MHRRITAREVLEGIGGGVSYNDPSSHLSNNTKTVLLAKKEKGSSGSSSGSKR